MKRAMSTTVDFFHDWSDMSILEMIQFAICPSGECPHDILPHISSEYEDCIWIMEEMSASHPADYAVSDWHSDRNWADTKFPNEY